MSRPTRTESPGSSARRVRRHPLSHPNVCVIHALGAADDGRRFITMEYVEGSTLRERLSPEHGPAGLREVLDLGIQIAAGVGAAHALGIVHRDLKPENVMVRADGLVKVLDFGLAKLAPSDPIGPTLDEPTRAHASTAAGTIVGTVAYMSPEQIRGLDVDGRSDIWSLGVVLYELTTGRRPFGGTSGGDVMAAILEREPPPLARFDPQLPGELQRIIGKALRKDREQRYQVIKDLRLDLEALRDELSVQARSSADAAVPAAGTAAASAEQHQSSAEYLVGQLGRHRRRGVRASCCCWSCRAHGWWIVRAVGTRHAPDTPRATVQRTLTRLTFGPGLQTDPALSPDGRFLAYSSDRNGNADIWVQPVGGGNPVQVTRSPAQDTQPAWSPDGGSLVFRSERDGGGLYIVPALGGMERQLTSFGTHPSWPPGSAEILFLDGIAPGEAVWPTRLFAVSPAEGAPRELLAGFLRRGAWYWISRHPDGRISAWGRHEQLGSGFFTLSLDGKQIVASKELEGSHLAMSRGFSVIRRRFQWHPRGAALYVQTLTDGVYNLWRVRVDPKTLAWVSAERLTTGPGADVSPAPVGRRHSARLHHRAAVVATVGLSSGPPNVDLGVWNATDRGRASAERYGLHGSTGVQLDTSGEQGRRAASREAAAARANCSRRMRSAPSGRQRQGTRLPLCTARREHRCRKNRSPAPGRAGAPGHGVAHGFPVRSQPLVPDRRAGHLSISDADGRQFTRTLVRHELRRRRAGACRGFCSQGPGLAGNAVAESTLGEFHRGKG